MLPDYISADQPTEDKIAWAEDCCQSRSAQLLGENHIFDLCDRLRQAIRDSQEQLRASGVAQACRQCDRLEGGSCCGAGLEKHYDPWLLLINLLLGVKLPNQRRSPKECFFLGNSGCLLPARHTICINYICKGIENRIDSHSIRELRQKEGEELATLFLLKESIKKALKA